ncbi:MAG: restriction endonuclease-like protein [Bacteroidales bacterium]|nr:restriction endonuclease-like protein [Bacteroidales bacterium]
MDLVVYTIPHVMTLTIGTNNNVAMKVRDYERRFAGAAHLVRYAASHDGTIELGYDEKLKDAGVEKAVRRSVHLQSSLRAKESLLRQPLVFEQLTYFFDIDFDSELDGLAEGQMSVRHYLSEFTDSFNARGRSLHGQFSFVNEPGDFRLEVRYRVGNTERSFWFDFVVASTKMDVLNDYRAILREIEHWDRSLVFSEKAKTLHEVQRAGLAEKDESKRWMVYFEKSLDVYERALKRILLDPHAQMVESPHFRRADQVRHWTPTLAVEYARYHNDPARIARHRFEESVREMTFDTKENRFVKHTVEKLTLMLQAARVEFAKDAEYSRRYKKDLADRIVRFKRYLRNPHFAAVGRYTGESESMVMQMRPGYSDIRVVWTVMNSVFSSDISLSSFRNPSVGLAKLSALYEFWCFLTVKKLMDGIMKTKFKIAPNAVGMVDAKKAVETATLDEDDTRAVPFVYQYRLDGHVVAQIAFQQSYGPKSSSDVFAGPFQQRPDIVVSLMDRAHVYTYLFDAKYQIENSSYTGFRDAAPRAALDQMHRYRDAILWRRVGVQAKEVKHEVVGAYILYPADVRKSDVLSVYDYEPVIAMQNIGAFPLLPDRTDGLNAFLLGLVNKLDVNATTSAWLLRENQVIPQRGLCYTDDEDSIVTDMQTVDAYWSPAKVNAILSIAYQQKTYPIEVSLFKGRDPASIKRIRIVSPMGAQFVVEVDQGQTTGDPIEGKDMSVIWKGLFKDDPLHYVLLVAKRIVETPPEAYDTE